MEITLLACWAADFADGRVARRLRCETLLGAQLDSYADRIVAAAALVAAVALAHMHLSVCVAAGAAWAQFGVADQFMSAQFLRFGLWTSDELHLVDDALWRLNFSVPAKIASNVPVALIFMGTGAQWAAAGISLALIATRVLVFTLGGTRSGSEVARVR